MNQNKQALRRRMTRREWRIRRCLLDSCTVVPLLSQHKRLLIADGVSGLVFDPFTPVLDLTYTTKN